MIGDKIYSKEEVEKFFNELRCEPKAGALSDQGIKKAIYDGDIFIYPFEGKCLTPIGYNFCPSRLSYQQGRAFRWPFMKKTENGT